MDSFSLGSIFRSLISLKSDSSITFYIVLEKGLNLANLFTIRFKGISSPASVTTFAIRFSADCNLSWHNFVSSIPFGTYRENLQVRHYHFRVLLRLFLILQLLLQKFSF